MTSVFPGWPRDGLSGDFIGWDAQGNASILRWSKRTAIGGEPNWVGVRLDKEECSHWPLAFTRGQGTEDFVKHHCPVDEARFKLEIPRYQVMLNINHRGENIHV